MSDIKQRLYVAGEPSTVHCGREDGEGGGEVAEEAEREREALVGGTRSLQRGEGGYKDEGERGPNGGGGWGGRRGVECSVLVILTASLYSVMYTVFPGSDAALD